MHPNKQKSSGFTLVEVLVSLAIMALAATSILTLIAQSTRFAVASEDRTMAAIAADNLMIGELAQITKLERGQKGGAILIAGRRFSYTKTVSETEIDALVQIEIKISDQQSGQVLTRITTLKNEPGS